MALEFFFMASALLEFAPCQSTPMNFLSRYAICQDRSSTHPPGKPDSFRLNLGKTSASRSRFFSLGIAIAILLIPASAFASIVSKGDYIRFDNGPGTHNGGEFLARVSSTNLGNSGWASKSVDFHTFCVEVNENIGFGQTYHVGKIGMVTVASGVSLTRGAAWLYEDFWSSTNRGIATTGLADLGSVPYSISGACREDDARSLQLAIWRFMGQVGPGFSGQSGSAAVKAKAQLYLDAAIAATNSFTGGAFGAAAASETRVRVMNIRKYATNGDQVDRFGNRYFNAQDQLVVIPEPHALVVWSVLGAASLVAVPRKKRQAI